MLRTLLVITALVAIALPAAAQSERDVRRDQRRAPVVFDMDEEVIEGANLSVPDVPVHNGRIKHTHKSLIQVRTTFAQELLASAAKL